MIGGGFGTAAFELLLPSAREIVRREALWPAGHQNECSMATARDMFCCTFGLHELAKFTLPSWPLPASSSCANAPLVQSAASTAMS